MSLMLLCSVLACCQTASAPAAPLPREMTLEEPRPRPPQDPTQERYPPVPGESAPRSERAFLDLDWLELTPAIGIAFFSSEYETDPTAALSLSAHAPLPWLSPSGDNVGEYFGLFAEAAFMNIDRNLSPTVDHRQGLASFFSLGLDFSIVRDGTWIVVVRAGALYAYYGGIADLNSGFGFMAGASVGLQISGKLGLTYSPEVLFGDTGSLIFLNTLGLSIQF
jgi:hypothetical protein